MMIMTDKHLIAEIDSFLAKTGMKPTAFGLATMGDGALVKQLKKNRSLSLRNAEKVVHFMKSYRPADKQAAA